jgi:hypothetical protein
VHPEKQKNTFCNVKPCQPKHTQQQQQQQQHTHVLLVSRKLRRELSQQQLQLFGRDGGIQRRSPRITHQLRECLRQLPFHTEHVLTIDLLVVSVV